MLITLKNISFFFINRIVLFLFISFNIQGQLPKNASQNYINFTIEDGLPSNETHTISEDHEGYLWFATDHGAVRYDGYQFKTYTIKDGLPDITILKIYKDYKNRLWFITLNKGIAYYKNGKIHPYVYNDILVESFKGKSNCGTFFIDTLNTLYYGVVNSDRIIKIDSTGNRSYIKNNFQKEGYMLHHENKPILKHYLNNDWYKTPNTRDSISYERMYHVLTNRYPVPLLSVLYNSKARYRGAITTSKDTLQFIADYNFFTQLTKNKKGKTTIKNYTFKDAIHHLFIDQNNNLYIASDNGIKIYKDCILKQKPDQHLLINKKIHYIYQDSEGGLWISSLQNGIYYLPPPNNAIYNFSLNQQLSGTAISTIKGSNNTLYIGYYNSDKIDKIKDTNITSLLYPNKDLLGKYTLKITTINNQLSSYLMYGSFGSAYTIKEDKLKLIFPSKYNIARSLKLDEGLYLQTDKNGVSYKIYNGKEQLPLLHPKIPRLKDMVLDESGIVWLATIGGLWSYNHAYKKFIYHGKKEKLFKNRIDAIKTDKNKLYIGTKGTGLLIKNKDQIFRITKNDGLTSNSIATLEVEDDTIWIGTLQGINKLTIHSYAPFQYRLEYYTTINNLISNQINTLFATDSILYAGTNKGISVIDKKLLKPNAIPPKMIFSKLKINNRNYLYDTLKQLDYRQNNLQIDYTALAYSSKGNLRYRYRLLPRQIDWIYTDKREIQYTNLAPNTYTFEVDGQNQSGIWSTQPATFTFIILPPFWARWWFIILEVIAGLFFVYILFMWRFKRVQRKMEKRILYQKKLNELKAMSLQSKMNPHFIFNSLNSIQNYILKNKKREANDYLLEFSKLTRLTLQNSDTHTVSLDKELETIRLYVNLEKKRLQSNFEYIEYIDPTINFKTSNIPALLIQPFIENAIWHGKIHTISKGKIIITIKRKENLLTIEIIDNGIGRKASSILNENKEKHKSYAISIAQNRLKLIGELNEGLSEISITDANPVAKNNVGTKVSFTIPYKLKDKKPKQHYKNNSIHKL